MSRDFLWTGVELRRSGSKVGWGQVCTPKCEVGFGLKPLKMWNKASIFLGVYGQSVKELIPCG